MTTNLKSGFYVRVPYDAEEYTEDFRDFRLGQIYNINPIANTAQVRLLTSAPYTLPTIETKDISQNILTRCKILPGTSFTNLKNKKSGRILLAVEDDWVDDQAMSYYVQYVDQDRPAQEDETFIQVGFTTQDPDPREQLANYELHHPKWRASRDSMVESYSKLRHATFGMEQLVGSRIMLLAHQAEVIVRVLSDQQCRYILADEVGLGKTIEACVILKGLLKRESFFNTLIVTPTSLSQQWQNELNNKFWLDFYWLRPNSPSKLPGTTQGYIITTENLTNNERLWEFVKSQNWGMLIVDEAHHVSQNDLLYQRLKELSAASKRALILSATPIQRHSYEYLKLLALMDPQRYSTEKREDFERLLKSQEIIAQTVSYVSKALTPDRFDEMELLDFVEALNKLIAQLEGDKFLPRLVEAVAACQANPLRGLEIARHALTYLSENYRIENRVIRNRRAHLSIALPVRAVETAYSYLPDTQESETLEALFEYIDTFAFQLQPQLSPREQLLLTEYCRSLMYAAASSPYALKNLIEQRSAILKRGEGGSYRNERLDLMVVPAAPREEPNRLTEVIRAVKPLQNERGEFLEQLLILINLWGEETDRMLERAFNRWDLLKGTSQHRLLQVLGSLHDLFQNKSKGKALVFSAWPQTLKVVYQWLVKTYGQNSVARFTIDQDDDTLQAEADRFQNDATCWIMLSDELGGEGRNFQIASQIVHIDIGWTPSQLEQRIGRVDRLGRTGQVFSIVPFAKNQPEADLFRIWNEAFELFTQSMSGMEIQLEGIQAELSKALLNSSRRGLSNIFAEMKTRATRLKAEVEEERYFEGPAVNRAWREEFEVISQRYKDGKLLGKAFLSWADMAGLNNIYDSTTDTFRFDPNEFHSTKMLNAKLFDLPDMQEALHRSRHIHDLIIVGTFNRDVASQKENLVFFAPGSDPWTDSIIKNAFEADRGRCCAILRPVPTLKGNQAFFDLFFSLSLDPRPLFESGLDPLQLYRALGFIKQPIKRLLIKPDGTLIPGNDNIWQLINTEYSNNSDVHLGQRGHLKSHSQLEKFKNNFPKEQWQGWLERVFKSAENQLKLELENQSGMVEAANNQFFQRLTGQRAVRQWLKAKGQPVESVETLKAYQAASAALIEGLKKPNWRLESACFWILKGR